MQETQVRSLGQEDPLEEENDNPLQIIAQKIAWTEEPGSLQFMVARVRHNRSNWSDLIFCKKKKKIRSYIWQLFWYEDTYEYYILKSFLLSKNLFFLLILKNTKMFWYAPRSIMGPKQCACSICRLSGY